MIAHGLLALTAVCCVMALAALGSYVTHRRLLTALDARANTLRGHGTRYAVAFTRAGFAPALTVVSVIVFVVARQLRWWPAFALLLPVVQLLSQGAAHLIKQRYRRIRPDDWLYRPELGFSFPSGHATTAAFFYGGLLVYTWSVPLPDALRVIISFALLAVIAGIPWSRLVLAAHYGTDVIGGFLLGSATLCVFLVLLRYVPALPGL